MIKAKVFWKSLCEGFNYRFFSGIPCLGLDRLYNTMDSELMHYIPAANENVALGLINGAKVSGINSALLLEAPNIYKLDLSFNADAKLPVLIITSGDISLIPEYFFVESLRDDLTYSLNNIFKLGLGKGKHSVLFIKEGELL